MKNYEGHDIYCDLIIPRTVAVNIMKETARVIAFHHTKPYWPVHIVVTPKHHVASLLTLDNDLAVELLAVIKEIATQVQNEHGAVRILTNLGAYQDSKHLHFHISSGVLLQ